MSSDDESGPPVCRFPSGKQNYFWGETQLLGVNKTGRPKSACWSKSFLWPGHFFAALFRLAQRFFCAFEISLRAAADIVRFFFGAPMDFDVAAG